MNVELLIIFIILNAVNVVIQTIKSLCTIKGGKVVAASEMRLPTVFTP